MASAEETAFSVEDVAVYLLNDALAQPNYFLLPDLNGKNIYLCNAINPYILKDDELVIQDDVECYFIKTDDNFIASITLCYDNDKLLTASLDIGLAEFIDANCDIDEAFALVGYNGTLYVKTAGGVVASNAQVSVRTVNTDAISNTIDNSAGNLEVLSSKSRLTEIVTNPIVIRSDKLLSVPYVPQSSNTCWAAAGAAFGRYYTGSTYAHYTAEDLSLMMGVNLEDGADIFTTQKMLSKVFNLSTIFYNGRLSDSVAIGLFQQNKPIIAGFQASFNHMMVLCGYDDHNTGVDITFYIRDSNTSSIITAVSFGSTGELALYYEGDVLKWKQTLY